MATKIKPYNPGTLVRVLDKALLKGAECCESNRELVVTHGYLYVVSQVDYDDVALDGEPDTEIHAYLCRSLATGDDMVPWYHDEIEGAEE